VLNSFSLYELTLEKQTAHSWRLLASDLVSVCWPSDDYIYFSCLQYAAELIELDLFSDNDDLFNVFHLALQQLQNLSPEKYNLVLREYESALLYKAGYVLDFTEDVTGTPIVSENTYFFNGEFFKPQDASGSIMVKGNILLSIHSNDFTKESLYFYKKIHQKRIEQLSGKKLKTPNLYIRKNNDEK
jgi:recombinational DNA repair protein (RecF pathway)|tara:strand:+ start:3041 stop:3598 length:558 start_codon:yes stop_codon:yes gene_type:complete